MNATALKLLAVASMLIDHTGAVLFPSCYWMRAAGRLAMPVFTFFIAEGCYYTRSKGKYLLRLLFFGLLSELPYDLAFFGKISFQGQNVMFTFALCVAALWLYELIRGGPGEDGHCSILRTIAGVLCVLLLSGVSDLLRLDYSYYAVIAAFLFHAFRGKGNTVRQLCGVGFFALTRTQSVFAWTGLSLFPLLLYNGRRGMTWKWFFYGFYPAHLLVLYGIRQCLR